MTNKGFIILLSSFLVAAAPASAASNNGNDQAKAAPSADGGKDRKYCLKETITGSRMSSQECKTKAEWTREGVDISEFAKTK
jgi:hypothetical protein